MTLVTNMLDFQAHEDLLMFILSVLHYVMNPCFLRYEPVTGNYLTRFLKSFNFKYLRVGELSLVY